jgi:hypothetical protein
MTFGVSGNLYNKNLVPCDRQTLTKSIPACIRCILAKLGIFSIYRN